MINPGQLAGYYMVVGLMLLASLATIIGMRVLEEDSWSYNQLATNETSMGMRVFDNSTIDTPMSAMLIELRDCDFDLPAAGSFETIKSTEFIKRDGRPYLRIDFAESLNGWEPFSFQAMSEFDQVVEDLVCQP